MVKYRLIIICILLFILFIFSTTGCWSRRELEDLGIVAGVALDTADKPGEIRLTAQVIKSGEMGSPTGGNGGSGGEEAVWNIQKQGETVFDIIRRFSVESSRRLFFSHNQVIIIGQELAKKGIADYHDFFIRDPELRRSSWYIVAEGKASKALIAKTGLEKIPAIDIAELMENYATTSFIIPVNVQDFTERLMSKTTEPIMPIITVNKDNVTEMVGTAIFKNEKMVDRLDPRETRGLLWILNKVKSGIVKVNCPNSEKKISLELLRSHSKITPEIKDENLTIKIVVKAEGNLGEQTCLEDLTTEDSWKKLEQEMAGAIKGEILDVFTKAQKVNADIFGFGAAVHRKFPSLWKSIEDNWDEYFPSLELDIIVEAKLRETGMITKPAKPE